MAEESDQEKTEQPTARKLEKAREEGQIIRSRELSTLLMLIAGLMTLWLLASWFSDRLKQIMQQGFNFNEYWNHSAVSSLVASVHLLQLALFMLAPFMLIIMLVALIAPNLLGGLSISAKSLTPDFKRLNPLQGFKRLFSATTFAELIKATTKMLLIGSVTALFIYQRLDQLLELPHQNVVLTITHAMRLLIDCVAYLLLAFIAVVVIDVPYQIYSHYKKLRMSRAEIKREMKEMEGDPQIKGRIRQQQQILARRRMMADVPTASVVITNPTHLAIALRYETGMLAPVLVAKGSNAVAGRIRQLAQENKVPLVEAPPLARSLFKYCDIGAMIPIGLYTAVAEILAWLHQAANSLESSFIAIPFEVNIPPELSVKDQSI